MDRTERVDPMNRAYILATILTALPAGYIGGLLAMYVQSEMAKREDA